MTLAVASIIASGNFSQSKTCGSVLLPGVSCTLSVTFTPTPTGTRTGAVTLTDSAAGGPQTVALAGAGRVSILTGPPASFH